MQQLLCDNILLKCVKYKGKDIKIYIKLTPKNLQAYYKIDDRRFVFVYMDDVFFIYELIGDIDENNK
jgi:hypothetical protein